MKSQYFTPLRVDIRINVDEIYELRHWAKQLGANIPRLRAAVEQVEPLIDVVRQHLKDETDPDNLRCPRDKQPEVSR